MQRYVGYIAFPIWLLAGFLDYLWHRQTKIETTAGLSESLMHTLMLAEGAPVVLGSLFLEINAGVLAMMIAAAVLHEATAIWDVMYTSPRRLIRPNEQHTHSFLEMAPFCVASAAICIYWEQFVALIGRGNDKPDFAFRLRRPLIPVRHVVAIFAAMLLVGGLPHAEELWRCYQAEKRALTGRDTPECARELFAS